MHGWGFFHAGLLASHPLIDRTRIRDQIISREFDLVVVGRCVHASRVRASTHPSIRSVISSLIRSLSRSFARLHPQSLPPARPPARPHLHTDLFYLHSPAASATISSRAAN